MKIHERLKSKAVDIHIQKMASLTLNGHHYAWLPTRVRARGPAYIHDCYCVLRYDSQEKSRACSARAARCIETARISRDDDIAPWHATIGGRLARLSFRVVPFGKGVTWGVVREGETDYSGDRRTIRRH